ncbi:hypothetical protein OMR07_26200 [Methylobacterium organophilum]|nr:hypothetical protein [Methylobacterium organophilum]
MPKKTLLVALATTLATAVAAVPVRAQTTGPAPTPPERVRPSADAPPQDQSLSDKLQKNDGVIKPPDSGTTGTVVKPDQSGSMPVIKPHELPGRDPGTEAK